jgi:DNA-binding LacI/PurR family transcriptional regulator
MPTNDAHRLTQRDIALRCGVSQMTVSLALRDSPKVSSSVRRQIMKTAKQLGWKPDPALSALVSYRHHSAEKKNISTVAWLTNGGAQKGPTYQAYRQGASARAEALGYKLEEFRVNELGMSSKRLDQILYSRGIQGLVLAAQEQQPALNLSWDKFAAVTCGFASTDPCLHVATSHHFHSAILALRNLRALGYHRVGVLLEQRNDSGTDRGLMEGCLMEQRRYSPGQMLPVVSLPRLTAVSLDDYLAANKPDVVLTNFDNATECLKELGIAVPRELGLAHLSIPMAGGRLAGINENAFAVGEAAIELVATMIQRNEFGIPESPRCVMIAGSWVQGRSVRRVNTPVKDLIPTPDSFQYRTEPLNGGTPSLAGPV